MEQKKTVLIVEDEKNIVDIIRFNLQRTGYNTLEAYDGEAGLAMAREKKPDLILLDVMMPKMMGFDVCRALRAEGDNVPVIILTAREEEEDKILGLEIGADDYITKPFSMRELLARVKANIRRTTMLSAPAAEDNAMSAGGGITINTDSFQVRKNGVPIDLTQREYELLTFLASHPGKVFSRVDLMEQVWNYGYCRRRRAHGGRHRPPPARKDRGQPRRAGLHPHAPRRGLLFLRAGVSCAHFSGKGVSCYVPQPAYEARDDHAAARHLADGGGGRVFDDQRHELLY